MSGTSSKELLYKELKKILPDYMGDETVGEIYRRLTELAERVKQGQARFLFGAGMSYDSGLQLFSALVRKMTESICLGKKDLTEKDLALVLDQYPSEAIAQAYETANSSTKLRDLIAAGFADTGANPHAGHDILHYLVNNCCVDRFYTTNWDNLIEKAFNGKGDGRAATVTDENVDDIERTLAKGGVPVIHLHGAVFGASKCLITERETYTLDTRLGRILMGELVHKWFVLVGYSMRDMDFRGLYFSVRELLVRKELSKETFVISPLQTKQDWEWRMADAVWRGRGITLVPLKAQSFLEYLKQQLEFQDTDGLLKSISDKLNIHEKRVLDKEIERRRELGLAREEAIRAWAASLGILGGEK